jgi:hypothetical protein
MKKFRKSALIILSILALFLVFAIWYRYTYSMDEAVAFEVNTSDMPSKLLIATQGSDFKNTVTQGVVDYYRSDSVFIKVIDVTALSEIVPDNYDAILVLHTWEYEKPPNAVNSFIEKTKNSKDKIVIVTTSGPGTSKMQGVDAITGESILADAPVLTARIIDQLSLLFETGN